MSQKIRKAIIPAAGYGTRFLPATKAMPKEMLPVVDKPIIQYVVEEAVESGIEDIIIVTGANKRAIEDHFDRASELEDWLKENHKEKELEEIKRIASLANFIYIRQKGNYYGNALPVLNAEHLVENESFAVLWGDEFIYSQPPRLKQMLPVFEKYQTPIISAVRIKNKNDLARYGIAKVKQVEGNVFQIEKIVEKPKPQEAPSNLATHGAYILTPDVFPILRNLKPGKNNELWLPDAISELIKKRPVYAVEIENARYYDTGNKLEYLKANIDFAVRNAEFNGELIKFLKNIVK